MVTLAPTQHPAERRRMRELQPLPHDHDVMLRPLGSREFTPGGRGGYADLIVTSAEAKFFPALVADLKRPDWRSRLAAMRRQRVGADGVLELGLPLHKRMQIVLFEAVCRRPGAPRLDPRQITASGLVVRRQGGDGWQGWLKRDGRITGWNRASEAEDYDPDPGQRRTSHKANAAIRAAIAARRGESPATSEDVTPLFVLPPEVCEARGRTILFGVIPVTSAETTAGPGPSIDFSTLDAEDRAEIVAHFSQYLRERPQTAMPRAGEPLNAQWNVLSDPRDATGQSDSRMKFFGTFLHQLVSELDLFGPSPAAQRLAAIFAGISLPTARDGQGRIIGSVNALAFLRDAMQVLIDATPEMVGLPAGSPPPLAPTMPLEWPRIDAELGQRLTDAALACLTAQHARMVPPQPRYDALTDRYAVKGFIRLKGHGDCPEKIVWSGYSEPFRILPWWDGDGPGIKIKLPSMSALRKIKPNVSFEIPPKIGAVLSGDLKALGKGEDPGPGLELGWLCSFSLPIITLCAFIVLHIFLSLLNIVFGWMLWFKICIPIPKKKSGA